MDSPLPQPVLEGPRVRLRELEPRDADGLFAVHADPVVMRYWSCAPWTTRAQAEDRIAHVRGERARGEVYAWAIADARDDALLGSVAAFALAPAQARAEVGISLRADRHGQGLAQEALRLAVAWLLGDAGYLRLEADIDPRNAASCRLFERVGFVREGLLRQRWRVNGEACDTALYGLLAPEFVAA